MLVHLVVARLAFLLPNPRRSWQGNKAYAKSSTANASKDFAKNDASIDPKHISGKLKKESQDLAKDTAKPGSFGMHHFRKNMETPIQLALMDVPVHSFNSLISSLNLVTTMVSGVASKALIQFHTHKKYEEK